MLDKYLKDLCRESQLKKEASLPKEAVSDRLKRQVGYGLTGAGIGSLANYLTGNKSTDSYLLSGGAGGLAGLVLERLLNPDESRVLPERRKGSPLSPGEVAEQNRRRQYEKVIAELEAQGIEIPDEDKSSLAGHIIGRAGIGTGAGIGVGVLLGSNYIKNKIKQPARSAVGMYFDQNPDAGERLGVLAKQVLDDVNNKQPEFEEYRKAKAELDRMDQELETAKRINAERDKLRRSDLFKAEFEKSLVGNTDYQKAQRTVQELEKAQAAYKGYQDNLQKELQAYRNSPVFKAEVDSQLLNDPTYRDISKELSGKRQLLKNVKDADTRFELSNNIKQLENNLVKLRGTAEMRHFSDVAKNPSVLAAFDPVAPFTGEQITRLNAAKTSLNQLKAQLEDSLLTQRVGSAGRDYLLPAELKKREQLSNVRDRIWYNTREAIARQELEYSGIPMLNRMRRWSNSPTLNNNRKSRAISAAKAAASTTGFLSRVFAPTALGLLFDNWGKWSDKEISKPYMQRLKEYKDKE